MDIVVFCEKYFFILPQIDFRYLQYRQRGRGAGDYAIGLPIWVVAVPNRQASTWNDEMKEGEL
jgi:hypothetical protein